MADPPADNLRNNRFVTLIFCVCVSTRHYHCFVISSGALLRLAHAFDVALLVKFVPFSKLVSEFSDASSEALYAVSFEQELPLLRQSARAEVADPQGHPVLTTCTDLIAQLTSTQQQKRQDRVKNEQAEELLGKRRRPVNGGVLAMAATAGENHGTIVGSHS